MKLLTILILSISGIHAAERRPAELYFYTCKLERFSQDNKEYKKEFVFQLGDDPKEENRYEHSVRWLSFRAVLKGTKKFSLHIQENVTINNKIEIKQSFSIKNLNFRRDFTFADKKYKGTSFRLECH